MNIQRHPLPGKLLEKTRMIKATKTQLKASQVILKTLTRLGVSRGLARRFIEKAWLISGADIVDAEIRGIHYQLHIRINPTDCKLLTSSKVYDKREILFLAEALKTAPDSHFVDVGANTGYYSLNLARIGYSKILAIEPNPATITIFRHNIALNNLQNQITASQMCIGEDGEIPLYFSNDLGSASVFGEDHSGASVMVRSIPLKDLLRQHDIHAIGSMKVDIEGYEDRALKPYFEATDENLWPHRMIIEHCNSEKWECDLADFLQKIGYSICHVSRSNLFLKLANT